MKKFITIFIILIAALFLQGCNASIDFYDKIDDYDGVLSGIGKLTPDEQPDKEPDDDDKDDEEVKLPEIEGFVITSDKAFDEQVGFGINNYAKVVIDGESFIMSKDGKLFEVPSDFTQLNYDKYIFETDGKKGVKDVRGKELLAARFIDIDISGNTILAFDRNSAYLFSESRLLKAVSATTYKTLSLFNEDIVLMDGTMYDLSLKELSYKGYSAVNIFEGVAIIKDSFNRLGYYNTHTDSIIEPQYVTASLFINGFAFVQKVYDGAYYVIDGSGKETACLNGQPCGFYDDYIFVSDNLVGLTLYDKDFKSTGLSFRDVYGSRVYGDFIIDMTVRQFFSLSKQDYVSAAFESIEVIGDTFLCKNSKGYVLYDDCLNVIVKSETLAFDGELLSVFFKDKFYLYRRVDNVKP